jgi:hypothetical protein
MTGTRNAPADPGPDPIFEFLRSHVETAGARGGRGMRRGWRPSPARIGGIAAVVVVIAAGIGLLATRRATDEATSGAGAMEVARAAEPAAEAVAARVVLVEGSSVLLSRGRQTILAESDQVVPGDTVVSEGAVGISYPDGKTLVMSGQARLNVREAGPDGVSVGLVFGTLAARVPEGSEGAPLRVVCTNAVVTVRGTVFAVSADRGRLVSASVSEGQVEVRSRRGAHAASVGRMERLDVQTWQVAGGSPDVAALERLARIASGVVVPEQAPGKEPEEAGARHLTLVERILKALREGNVELAVGLVEKQGKGQKGADFLSAAGEAYRRAGRWAEAVQSYLGAAKASSGKKAEKAMLRAADIELRKMQEPLAAADVIESYLVRFPAGELLDEALYIGGVSHSRAGNHKRAVGLFEKYLRSYPKGAQAARVHLALAKIQALKLSDCASASKHLKAVKASGGVLADEAAKVQKACAVAP